MTISRFKITIEYDGTTFCGWQKQDDKESIQSQIQKAIYSFSHQKVDVIGSGRTDAGVHALGQVAHFDLDTEYSEYKILSAINHYLKEFAYEKMKKWENFLYKQSPENTYKIRSDFNSQPISIVNCEKVSDDFDARFSAKKRYYRYIVLNQKQPTSLHQNRVWHIREEMNIEKMKIGANFLLGKHDFSSFRDSECQAKSPIKTLDDIQIFRDKCDKNKIIFEFTAKSFLHHMIRNIVGTLKEVGVSNIKPEKIKEILEAKDRTKAGQTCPACGLYFVKVDY
jgi:tRNA pseudouridine38-40 synthase